MGAPSVISSGVGFRNCQILALDANGIIAASGTGAYEGVQISGAKTLTITDPDPTDIVHLGDDSIFALDVLPPKTPITGELTAGKQSDTLDIVLTGVKTVTIGEAEMFAIGTNKRGSEAQVCMLAYRQAIDTDPASSTYGKRVWQFRLFPRTYVIPRESGFTDTAEDRTYAVRPLYINKYPWGVSLVDATDGAVRSQGSRGVAEFKPKLLAFVANGTQTAFTFPTASPAADTAKIITWLVNATGVGAVTTADTKTTQAVQFTTAPTTGTLVVKYETN